MLSQNLKSSQNPPVGSVHSAKALRRAMEEFHCAFLFLLLQSSKPRLWWEWIKLSEDWRSEAHKIERFPSRFDFFSIYTHIYKSVELSMVRGIERAESNRSSQTSSHLSPHKLVPSHQFSPPSLLLVFCALGLNSILLPRSTTLLLSTVSSSISH